MEFLHIYLLLAAAIACLTAIAITKVIHKTTLLPGNTPTFIQDYLKKLERNLERSRTGITVQQFFVLQIGCPAMLAFLSALISTDRSLMLVLIILGAMLPNMFLLLQKSNEDKKFEDRFVRALTQMASSLHAGMTVEQAVDSVVDCELLHESIRDEFRLLSSKLKLGTSISDAFFEFAQKTENKDVHDVATAITIMTAVGGDAGVAIEKLQKNIEDRLMYRKKRESMMTESKIIVLFADLMAIVILIGTYLFMPDTIQSYFQSPILTVAFIIIISILLIGSIVVHKMLGNKIDVN